MPLQCFPGRLPGDTEHRGRPAGKGRKEVSQTPNSVRPWGSYHILDESERYKIKRIVIAPGNG
jgi:mannose-6-phosphate isomerase-like protein (cupin superfamily)